MNQFDLRIFFSIGFGEPTTIACKLEDIHPPKIGVSKKTSTPDSPDIQFTGIPPGEKVGHEHNVPRFYWIL